MTKKKQRRKVCTHCGRELPIKEFYVTKRGHTASWCKECQRENKRAWYNRTRKVPDGIRMNPETGLCWSKKGAAKRIYWTRRMLDDLKQLFPTTKNEEMAGILGVSVRTAIRKARELGLRKSPEWQHAINMSHVRMAHLEGMRLGWPSQFKKGEHFCPENEYKKGHQLSPEEREKQKKGMHEWYLRHPFAARDRAKKLMKPVRCVDTGETYQSIVEAARHIGIRPSYLGYKIKNGKTVNGLTYSFINNQ